MAVAKSTQSDLPLRVLQAGPTSLAGGVANSIKTLCVSLRSLGHNVVVATNRGSDAEELQARGIKCEETDLANQPRALLRSSWQFRRLLNTFRPHVVHVHGRSTALRCAIAGRKADWFTLHNSFLTHRVGFYDVGLIRKYFSPWGRNFFVFDQLAANYLQGQFGVNAEAIVQIYNGVDCEHFHAPSAEERARARAYFNVTPQQTFVVFVGRLHPSKQPLAVVEAAFRAVQIDRKDLRFALVGDGELRDIVAGAIREREVDAICTLHPWMNPLNAYFAADLIVAPSLFEGFPLVPAEAIATGCPVLRSRTGGSSHMIREGISGFECQPDPNDFISRLFRVLENPAQLTQMRLKAREFALTHLDAMSAARLIISAYRSRLSCSS